MIIAIPIDIDFSGNVRDNLITIDFRTILNQLIEHNSDDNTNDNDDNDNDNDDNDNDDTLQ